MIRIVKSTIDYLIDTESYTPTGIAIYTNTSLEIIEDIYAGRYVSLPADFLYRLIELDFSFREQFYASIIDKIAVIKRKIAIDLQ